MKTMLTWILLFAFMAAFAACWNENYPIPPPVILEEEDDDDGDEDDITPQVANDTPIGYVAISITGPQKGMIPETMALGMGNFNIGSVTWSPSPDGSFEGGEEYTAKVLLMADNGYTFKEELQATINAEPAETLGNTGATVTVSRKFPPTSTRTITSIDITSQPTKLDYTYGDSLDLTGLVVELTYDSGGPESIPFTIFATKNITTSPVQGVILNNPIYNSAPVTITCGSLQADTDPLTVSPPPTSGPTICTVSFDLNEGFLAGGATQIAPTNTWEGWKVPMPTRTPIRALRLGEPDYMEPGLYKTTNGVLVEPTYIEPGLYKTTNNVLNQSFGGWYFGDEQWDFDNDVVNSNMELKAKYVNPSPEILSGGSLPTAAFTYINIAAKAGEYTLMLPGSTTYTGFTLNTTDTTKSALPKLTQQNVDLYIRSNGSVVTFQKPIAGEGALLYVGPNASTNSTSNVRVTIGNNIVLRGAANNRPVVVISGGASVIMESNSKVTGNNNSSSSLTPRETNFRGAGAAVAVGSGTLTMRGTSTITGNTTGANGWYGIKTGGVFVYRWGTLIMEGSASVYGNNTTDVMTSDVWIDRANSTLTTSANVNLRGTLIMREGAFIGRIALVDSNINGNDNTTFVTIKSAMMTNNQIEIYLWSDRTINASPANNNNWLAGTPLLRAAAGYTLTQGDVDKFILQKRTGANTQTTTVNYNPVGGIVLDNNAQTSTGNTATSVGRLSAKN